MCPQASAVEREAYLSLHTEEEMSDIEEEESEEEDEDEEGLNAAIQASKHTWIMSPLVSYRTSLMPYAFSSMSFPVLN